jgi:protein TonB
MVLGISSVFGMLIAMNAQSKPAPNIETARERFVAIEKKKQPPRTKRQQVRKRVMKKSAKPLAPIPTLGTSLSGNAFGIPNLINVDLTEENDTSLLDNRDLKNMVMTDSTADIPPQPVARTSPEYPQKARARGISGHVTLGLLISDKGEVLRVRVLESSPPGVFEQSAMDAVRSWRFEPARYREQTVKVWARQTLQFKLT